MTGLDDHQSSIVDNIEGILCVDAGPGTGKTRTITERYLSIVSSGVDPKDVLLLTFTDNAAREMRDRIVASGRLDDVDVETLSISTFHSMATGLLRRGCTDVPSHIGIDMPLPTDFNIVSDDEMAFEMFSRSYSRTIRGKGARYGGLVELMEGNERDVHNLVNKLMSHGVFPTVDGWFMDGGDALMGDRGELMGLAESANVPLEGKRGPIQSHMVQTLKPKVKRGAYMDIPSDMLSGVSISDELLREAVLDLDPELETFVHDVYLDLIRTGLRSGRLTFGMLIMFAFIALLKDPDMRQGSAYEHVMIDEFQDTNRTQFMMAMLLMGKGNLCVVGDWRQGIFGFRDAEVENIIDFPDRLREFHDRLGTWGVRLPYGPGPVLPCRLMVNYRSSTDIIRLSPEALTISVTKGDEPRLLDLILRQEGLETGDPTMDEMTSVRHLVADDETAEMMSILSKVQEFKQGALGDVMEDGGRGPRWSDVAVLSRDRAFGTRLQALGAEHNIPMVFDGGLPVFNTREAKLVLAWLRVLIDPRDRRGWVTVLTDQGRSPADIRLHLRNGVPDEEREFLRSLRGVTNGLYPILNKVFEHHRTRNDDSIAITELLDGVFRSEMIGLREIVRLIEANIESGKAVKVFTELPVDAVRIHTIHGAKGLEYPYIILANVNDKRFPSTVSSSDIIRFDPLRGLRRSKRVSSFNGMPHVCDSWQTAVVDASVPRDNDEERRLLYVAISRAKQHLLVTSFRPSPFVKSLFDGEIPDRVTMPETMTIDERPVQAPPMVVPHHAPSRRTMTAHSLMGRPQSGGPGRGPEFGRRVHVAAEMIAHGHEPSFECIEVDNVRSLLAGLDGKARTEVECVADIDGALVVGRVDLIVDHGGRIEVIDYKTDVDRANHGRYVIQMSVYHAAVSGATGRPTTCGIAYLANGELIEVEPLTIDELTRRARDV